MDLSTLKREFARKRPKSQELFDRLKGSIAGGVNGNLRFYEPFPVSFQKGDGATLVDVDGHQYLDYLLSYGAMMLGHGHPVIREAVSEVWAKQGSSSFGAPHELEIEMAGELQDLFPSLEEIRFTNSGLEATLFSLRLALAYTGRSHIAKFEGHYHGAHDQVLVSVSPDPEQAGSAAAPRAVAGSYALPDYHLDHTVVLPFNDWDACEEILTGRKDEIGAVILEPMLAGYIPASGDFMKKLRILTRQLGMVLIFDEVKTGLRVALGGAQELYGVAPDLTALGKIVGGGFPVGIVGGSRDVMAICSTLERGARSDAVFHSGTFNGNPMSLAAGLATIKYLKRPGCFEGIVANTERLRAAIEKEAAAHGFEVRTLGVGAVFNLLFTGREISNYRDLGFNDRETRLALDYLLMDRGIFTKPMNRFSTSAVHGPAEIDASIAIFSEAFAELKALKQRL